MNKIIIFGNGEIAQLANYYFENDSDFEVVAFCVDKEYIKSDFFEDKPVVNYDNIENIYPPEKFKMFIALSYAKMNTIRQEKYFSAKSKGYALVSYISSRCNYLSKFEPGDNCFILEDNTIQPFVNIGSNITLWSGNHIGHHSELQDHIFISSHVVISGHCTIQSNTFLGVNSTIGHNVIISKGTLIGAGVIQTKNTEENGVYLPPKSVKIDKKSFEIAL